MRRNSKINKKKTKDKRFQKLSLRFLLEASQFMIINKNGGHAHRLNWVGRKKTKTKLKTEL